MERVRKPLGHALAFLLMLAPGSAAYPQSTSGTVRTTIVPRLSLVKTADLEFGQIMASSSTAGTVSAGAFTGLGTRNQLVVFSFGAPSVVLTRTNGAETMTADTFTLGPSTAGGLNQLGNSGRWRIISNNGLFTLPVGATLRVGANQTPGDYQGTFTLTAIYQ